MGPAAFEDWVNCPPGELRRLANRLRGRRQRRAVLKAVVAAAAGSVALGGAGWYWFRPPRDYEYAGITCTRVAELVPVYRAGTLPADLRRQVDLHVAECPHCRPRFRDMGLF